MNTAELTIEDFIEFTRGRMEDEIWSNSHLKRNSQFKKQINDIARKKSKLLYSYWTFFVDLWVLQNGRNKFKKLHRKL